MTDAPWLTDEQLLEWKSLVGLVMTLPGALDAQLKRDAGLNSFEYHVLVALAQTSGRLLPMSDLAVMAQGSPSRLSHAVARLEQAGWVVRRSCPGVGRRVEAHLTDAGLAKLEEAAPDHAREARRLVVDVLTPEQLATLGEAARRIVDAIDPDYRERLDRATGC